MRTKKSAINMATALISQFIIILLGFISRRVMIDSIGVEYLGINGLMNNILTILSLAESGVGTAMVYALYKPLADNDIPKIRALMNFYKNSYRALAILTALIGLSIFPFLDFFIKDSTVENSGIIYLMFLFSSVSSYLYSYKISMNNADQNKYLSTVFNTVTQILVLVVKVLILYVTKNYILFLSIDIGSTLIKNIIFSRMMDKRYPYLKDKSKVKLDDENRKVLYTNIKALFFGKIGYILSTCSDNLVISSMISLKTVGLYSNYTTLTSSVTGFVGTFILSIGASVGNLMAKESEDKVYDIFKVTTFINFWLYGFSAICLFSLSEPFIALWLGEEYIMRKEILILIVFNFLIGGLMAPIDSINSAAGLYKPDRFIPIIAAIVNLILSIILVKSLGLAGVLIGTLASTILFSFWIKPMLVYKYIFINKKLFNYFVDIIKKILFIILVGCICSAIGDILFKEYTILNFIGRMIICLVIPNSLIVSLTYKSNEFKYLRSFSKPILQKFKLKQVV